MEKMSISGRQLVDSITPLIGLPKPVIEKEIQRFLHRHNKKITELTVEDLRDLANELLLELSLESKTPC